jgi:hypothetical protein
MVNRLAPLVEDWTRRSRKPSKSAGSTVALAPNVILRVVGLVKVQKLPEPKRLSTWREVNSNTDEHGKLPTRLARSVLRSKVMIIEFKRFVKRPLTIFGESELSYTTFTSMRTLATGEPSYSGSRLDTE